MCAFGAVACVLALYREAAGLGPASGMNDAYAWGIWKTFNIMVLTGLGSGSFAIGIAVWIFGQHRLHSVMRTAVLSSFLTYASGLTLLGIDVGRPWNFFSILLPWRWNAHSPMLEIAFCMPLYTAVPLLIENIPTALDWISERWPELDFIVFLLESLIKRIYPFVLGLGFLLPAMHQSSLGALMLLAGTQVHPLWQTPLLPLFYVGAAAFMGFAFVSFILLVSHLVWDRPIDIDVLCQMSRITAWIIAPWLALRFADVVLRGNLPLAFQTTQPAALFWLETLLLVAAVALLLRANRNRSAKLAFLASVVAAVGGMLYRFDPTTLVYQPSASASYFPSLIELAVTAGFISLAVAAFSLFAKVLAILPAPTELWYAMESARTLAWMRTKDYAVTEDYAAAD
jgi:Ni/Fe-hydrogenase subunit HybB-like protein